jgi:hypothetical protein
VLIVGLVAFLGWSVSQSNRHVVPTPIVNPMVPVFESQPVGFPGVSPVVNPWVAPEGSPYQRYIAHELENSRRRTAAMNLYLQQQLERSARQTEAMNRYLQQQLGGRRAR